ncbi:MAG: leucine-rich repeat domain-containing protein [Lepagella sp.]
MKTFYKVLFVLTILIANSISASAIEFTVDGVRYSVNNDNTTVTVAGYSSGSEPTGDLNIPESVTYGGISYSVTSIDDNAFYYCLGLTSVTIPNSVTEIGRWAFEMCTGLTSVTIPNSVTSIGYKAFVDTAWYNNQPDGLVYAGLVAYQYKGTMPRGTSIVIKEGTKGIASYAFYYCTGLRSVTIPNSVTSIGDHAFYCCSGLTSVTIPNSVTSIGNGVFDGTAWYKNQPDGLVYAGYVAYQYKGTMPSGTSIVIKEGTKVIADCAFYDCSGLTSVTIPNSVTSIGLSVFWDCSDLTSVTIPNSVTSIGDYAFGRCSGLTSIKVESGNSVYDSRENCNAIIKTATNTLITGCKNTIIPNSVTSIGYWAFYGCSDLTSVTIPNSVTEIGESAFSFCFGLTSVTIPNSVTSIGYYAFHDCIGLTSVTIGNSVTSIGSDAFSFCSGLTSVTIPNSVTSIGHEAFSFCSGLTSVTIPNSVTSIGYRAFSFCSCLTRIDAYPDPEKVSTWADAFYKVPKDGTLHVLPQYLSAYQTASQWKDFTNIKGDLTEIGGIEVVRVDELDHTLPMNVYNMNGVKMGDRLEDLPAGIYIVRQGSKSAKVVK